MEQSTKDFTTADLEGWVDEAVMSFIIDMKYKLRLNNHKGHWRSYGVPVLLDRMAGEVSELITSTRVLESKAKCSKAELLAIVHECADVANYVLMIADNIKCLMRANESNERGTGQNHEHENRKSSARDDESHDKTA